MSFFTPKKKNNIKINSALLNWYMDQTDASGYRAEAAIAIKEFCNLINKKKAVDPILIAKFLEYVICDRFDLVPFTTPGLRHFKSNCCFAMKYPFLEDERYLYDDAPEHRRKSPWGASDEFFDPCAPGDAYDFLIDVSYYENSGSGFESGNIIREMIDAAKEMLSLVSSITGVVDTVQHPLMKAYGRGWLIIYHLAAESGFYPALSKWLYDNDLIEKCKNEGIRYVREFYSEAFCTFNAFYSYLSYVPFEILTPEEKAASLILRHAFSTCEQNYQVPATSMTLERQEYKQFIHDPSEGKSRAIARKIRRDFEKDYNYNDVEYIRFFGAGDNHFRNDHKTYVYRDCGALLTYWSPKKQKLIPSSLPKLLLEIVVQQHSLPIYQFFPTEAGYIPVYLTGISLFLEKIGLKNEDPVYVVTGKSKDYMRDKLKNYWSAAFEGPLYEKKRKEAEKVRHLHCLRRNDINRNCIDTAFIDCDLAMFIVKDWIETGEDNLYKSAALGRFDYSYNFDGFEVDSGQNDYYSHASRVWNSPRSYYPQDFVGGLLAYKYNINHEEEWKNNTCVKYPTVYIS